MKVNVSILKESTPCREYLQLVKSKYGNCNGFSYYFDDLQKAFYYLLKSTHQIGWQIRVQHKSKLLAHTIIIVDDRLPNNQGLFGFFECAHDQQVFDLLWLEVKRIATIHGIRRLRGPISATTWHPYRVIKSGDGAEYFPSEPITEDYYYTLLQSGGEYDETGFHSGMRKNFDAILNTTAPAYNNLIDKGFIINLAPKIDAGILQKLYILSSEIFRENYGFVNFNLDEFLTLYDADKLTNHMGDLYLASKENEVFGFCTTIHDKRRLIVKTIGILPNLQGIGLGNALVHKLHADAKHSGVTELIYALVRNGNQVKNFPKDDVEIIREYSCFDFKIY